MKILFISFHFPPDYKVAVNRTYSMAKYLARMSHEVHVLTVKKTHVSEERSYAFYNKCREEGIILHETGFFLPELVREYFQIDKIGPGRRILSGVMRTIFSFLKIEPWIGWNRSALKKAKEIVSENNINLVIASGGPFFSFIIAKKIKREFSVPYMLDYRDLWTGDPTKIKRPWYVRKLETSILTKASALVVIAPSMKTILESTFSCPPIYCITNGYDLEVLDILKEPDKDNVILYAGQFHLPIGGVEEFIKVMRELENEKIVFKYIGKNHEYVSEKCKNMLSSESYIIHKPVERAQSIKEINKAKIVLVVLSNNLFATEAERGVLSGKLFELLGLGKHLLIIAPKDSDVHTLLPGYKGIFSSDQTEEMADYIRWIFNENPPEPGPNPAFDWRNLIKQYEEVLNQTVRNYKG